MMSGQPVKSLRLVVTKWRAVYNMMVPGHMRLELAEEIATGTDILAQPFKAAGKTSRGG
jgi:hypothetical protein